LIFADSVAHLHTYFDDVASGPAPDLDLSTRLVFDIPHPDKPPGVSVPRSLSMAR